MPTECGCISLQGLFEFLQCISHLCIPICNAFFHGRNSGCELIVCRSECLFELSGIDYSWTLVAQPQEPTNTLGCRKSSCYQWSRGVYSAKYRNRGDNHAGENRCPGGTPPPAGAGGTTMMGSPYSSMGKKRSESHGMVICRVDVDICHSCVFLCTLGLEFIRAFAPPFKCGNMTSHISTSCDGT
jgi:hypothetical protein